MNLLSHPRALLGTLLLGTALAGGGHALAAGTTFIDQPIYEWSFWETESDGLGDTLDPIEVVSRLRIGGVLDEGHRLTFFGTEPHAHVYSNEGAITFWTDITTPKIGLFPPKHAIIGGQSKLTILQTYRKDEVDATIKFTINDIFLRGLELGGPRSNVGLEGSVSFAMRAHDVSHPGPLHPVIDRFDSLTRLSGRGLEWDIDNSGPLALDVTGSVFGPRVTIDLLAPYSRPIDVSSIEVGGLFVVEFTTVTSAFDTVQFDSRMEAYGRDPIDPLRGSFFEIEGLTPMNVGFPTAVPEPETYALMLAGLALVAARRWSNALKETPGRSQVSLTPSGGLTRSGRFGGAQKQLQI